MKRIEAVVQDGVAKKVVDAVQGRGAGVTLVEALGRGEGERPWIGGSHGHRVEFNSTGVIITVVDDGEAGGMVEAIMEAAHTGASGDGMVFVTDVADAYDITTKKKV